MSFGYYNGILPRLCPEAANGHLNKMPGFYVVGLDFVADVLEIGKYDGVADLPSDLYLAQVAPVMACGGNYVTRGAENKISSYTGVERSPSEPGGPLGNVMLRSIRIPGNSLGTTWHLTGALAGYAAGLVPVAIDSVCCDDRADILGRIPTSADCFGKGVFLYA